MSRNMKIFPMGVSICLAGRSFDIFQVAADAGVRKVAGRHTVQKPPHEPVFEATHHARKGSDDRRLIRDMSRSTRFVEPPTGPTKLIAHSGNYSFRGRKRRFEPSQARRDARRFELRMEKVTAEAEKYYEQMDEELQLISPVPLSISVI